MKENEAPLIFRLNRTNNRMQLKTEKASKYLNVCDFRN